MTSMVEKTATITTKRVIDVSIGRATSQRIVESVHR